jgi:hypothetical protein
MRFAFALFPIEGRTEAFFYERTERVKQKGPEAGKPGLGACVHLHVDT